MSHLQMTLVDLGLVLDPVVIVSWLKKLFVDLEELSEGDDHRDVFDGLGNGANRRPTPYPAHEQLEIPERRSNTPSCNSMRKLSSQRLSDACSLLDETIAEVEDEISIFEKSLGCPLSVPSLD